MATKTILVTSGTTWTVPADWVNAGSVIRAIGAGGGGGLGTASLSSSGGGGGGMGSNSPANYTYGGNGALIISYTVPDTGNFLVFFN